MSTTDGRPVRPRHMFFEPRPGFLSLSDFLVVADDLSCCACRYSGRPSSPMRASVPLELTTRHIDLPSTNFSTGSPSPCSRDRETVSGTDFGDRMGVVADSSRNPLSTRSMWRATGADGAGFARRYWLSPNSANAWPLQGADRHRSFLISFSRIPRPMGANKIKELR